MGKWTWSRALERARDRNSYEPLGRDCEDLGSDWEELGRVRKRLRELGRDWEELGRD